MAIIMSGRMGEVRAGADLANAKIVGLLTNFSIKISSQVQEIGYMNAFEDDTDLTIAAWGGSKDFVSGHKWDGSAEGYIARKDLDDSKGYIGQSNILDNVVANPSGGKTWLTMYLSNDTGNNIVVYYAGQVVISDLSYTADAKDGLKMSFSYVGKGPLTVHREGDV